MRRLAWAFILLMFIGGSIFSLGCAPKGEPEVSDASTQTEQPEGDDNGGE